MSRRRKSASTGMAAALVVSIIIIISIATYATVVSNGNESTYVSCTATTSTLAAPQGLAVVIPEPESCAHKISLSGFSLTPAGSGTSNSNSLRGTISVESQSPLTGLILYLNGTYELYSGMTNSNTTHYSIQYGAVLSGTEPIVAGKAYSVEFIALFQDGTATIASTQISAA